MSCASSVSNFMILPHAFSNRPPTVSYAVMKPSVVALQTASEVLPSHAHHETYDVWIKLMLLEQPYCAPCTDHHDVWKAEPNGIYRLRSWALHLPLVF